MFEVAFRELVNVQPEHIPFPKVSKLYFSCQAVENGGLDVNKMQKYYYNQAHRVMNDKDNE